MTTVPPGWYIFDPEDYEGGGMWCAGVCRMASGALATMWYQSSKPREMFEPFASPKQAHAAIDFSRDVERFTTTHRWRIVTADDVSALLDMQDARHALDEE